MPVLPIDLLQSIHHVVRQALAAVDHNWALNKVATPLGTFHIIILSRKEVVVAFPPPPPLFEFGKIPGELVWAPKNLFCVTGEFHLLPGL